MSQETTVILRSLLMQALRAESVKEIQKAIEALCTQEDVDVVKQRLREMREDD